MTLDDAATQVPVSCVHLSSDVADFLLEVVNTIQLPAAADNFEQQAALIVRAKRELSS